MLLVDQDLTPTFMIKISSRKNLDRGNLFLIIFICDIFDAFIFLLEPCKWSYSSFTGSLIYGNHF